MDAGEIEGNNHNSSPHYRLALLITLLVYLGGGWVPFSFSQWHVVSFLNFRQYNHQHKYVSVTFKM
jgi:hypothetical protein